MKLTDARVVSNELDEGLQALHRIAMEASDDMASEWAQAVLAELQELRSELRRLDPMEARAEEVANTHAGTAPGRAARYILTGETS